MLVPGLFGVLSRGTFLVCAVAIGGCAWFVPAIATQPQEDRVSSGENRADILLALTAVIAVSAWLVGELVHAAGHPVTGQDALAFDLPIIGQWIQSGSVWHLTELFPYQVHGTYPQSGHLLLAAFVLPFHNDAFVRFPGYLYTAVTGATVYGIARELRATRSTAAVFAAMFANLPMNGLDLENSLPDPVGLATFAAGLLFLVRHARTKRTSDLVMAGLGLGFAAGTKWYFTSSVAALAVLWLLLSLVGGRPLAVARGRREVLARWARLASVAALAAGFWLIRNLVQTGDPFYPVLSGAPDPNLSVFGFTIAHYITDLSVIRHYVYPAFRIVLGLPGLLTLAGLCWALLRARQLRSQWRELDSMLLLLTASAVLLAVVYALTPYSAFGPRGEPFLASVNVRYLIPALCVAVPAIAATVGTTGPRVRAAAEFAAVVATLQGVHGAYTLLHTGRKALAVGLAITLAAVCVGILWRRRHFPAPRPALVIGLGAVIAVAALGGYEVQQRLNRSRYASSDPTFAWIQQHPSSRRIGLTASNNFFSALPPAWPMFGPNIENHVAFVGRLDQDRLIQPGSLAGWLRAVHAGRYDMVEIALHPEPSPAPVTQLRWALAAGFPVVSRSASYELVRVPRRQPS
ncbi:MAG: glycosyltransferase family 39 protein [Solirubrobacterales bacterium]|nr:glycosyltransferase family 39 protein [Solirubrobacterales bacterium]